MPLSDRQLRIAIVMNRIVKERFTDLEWTELATLTRGEDIVYNHPRFVQMHQFSYEDAYLDDDLEIIKNLLDSHAANTEIMSDYLKVPEWLRQHNPHEYSKLFAHDGLLLEELSRLSKASSFDLNQNIVRIKESIDTDPELAIGSMKDLLEGLMKQVLKEYGKALSGKERFPDLLKDTQRTLNLDPSDLDETVKGRDLIKRILSNLGQVALNINELRNIYGSGKGRVRRSGITPRHARLVVNAGTALAVFLVETYEHHKATEMQT